MSVKKITKGDFAGFVEAMIEKQKVVGVQAKGDRFDFAPWSRPRTCGWITT